jgi:methylated-DNA-protein-cysteine methyltransferase-like protein
VSDSPPGYRRIYRVVRRIPRGKVATYGQIAVLAGIPRQPRQVGYALYALPRGAGVPWQRVINAKGEVSQRSTPGYEGMQRAALESEGVVFDTRGRVDLTRYQWRPAERWRSR